MKTHAFRRGFARGISAPFTFFSPNEIHRPPKRNGSVEKAWADVGRLISDATKEQGKRIEQGKAIEQSQD